jgi:hypothetical protein
MFPSEDRQGRPDRVMTSPGVGHNAQRLCWSCNKPKSQDGGRYVSRLRLWHCASCAPRRDEVAHA